MAGYSFVKMVEIMMIGTAFVCAIPRKKRLVWVSGFDEMNIAPPCPLLVSN